MVKEAILDAASKRVIVLTVGEIKGSYFDVTIKVSGIVFKDSYVCRMEELLSPIRRIIWPPMSTVWEETPTLKTSCNPVNKPIF